MTSKIHSIICSQGFKRSCRVLLLSLLWGAAENATAGTIIQETYNFTVGGFEPIGGPEHHISGSFTTTYETLPPGTNGTNTSTLDAINLSINGFTYTLDNTELIVRNARTGDPILGRFELGGKANGGVYGGGNFTDDFGLFFTDFGFFYDGEDFQYTVQSSSSFYEATTFDITRGAAAVPEPSTLGIAVCGCFSLIGWMFRRQSGI